MLTSILVRILTYICKSYCLLCPPFSGLLICKNSQDSARTHAMTYYSEIMQNKISKGESAGGEVGKIRHKSQSSLPVESQGMHLIPPARCVTTCVECCLPGRFIRDSVSGFYLFIFY